MDPITVTKDRMADPQRLNLYAYVRNSPLNAIDKDGRYEHWMHEAITDQILQFVNEAGGIGSSYIISDTQIADISSFTGSGPGGADSPEFAALNPKGWGFGGNAYKLHFPSEDQLSSALSDMSEQIINGNDQQAGHEMHSVQDGKGAHKSFAGKGFFGMIGHVVQSGLSEVGIGTSPDRVVGDKKFENMANVQYQALTGNPDAKLSKKQIKGMVNAILGLPEAQKQKIVDKSK